jgi:hypothetical protein
MRTPPSALRFGALALGCGFVGWALVAPDATRAAAGLLPDAGVASLQAAQAEPDPTVLRSRYVTIDVAAFPNPVSRDSLAREPTLTLDLFPNVTVRAVFDRFDPNADGVTWVGHVDGVAMSSVTLVYGGGLLTGSVVMPRAAYSIRPATEDMRLANSPPGRELHVVAEVNQAGFLKEAPPIEVQLSGAEIASAADVAPRDTAEFVDLMVLYTSQAMSTSGGATAIFNLINLGVSETNTSFSNSGISQRVRLAHVQQVSYIESSSFSTNLNQLRSGTGELSGVPALREAHRADLVMLVVRPAQPDACGIAFLMTNVSGAFAPSGVNVVDSSCIANYTFAHELGHNMGARHDWYVDAGMTPFSYAHGHVNSTASQRWRTIMAYPDMCADQGFNCGRVLYWASPITSYLPNCTGRGFDCSLLRYWHFPGSPMGVPGGTNTSCRVGIVPASSCDADDARTLNATALTVANFRQALSSTARR